MKSKVIALSAISSGFIAIFLCVGAYISFVDVLSVIIASIFILLPMYYNSRLGSFLAFLAGGVIAFIFSGANIYTLVFPSYFLFFGVLPLVGFIVEKTKFNRKIWFIIKLLWCVGICYFLLFYYTSIMGFPLEYTLDVFGKSIDLSGYKNIYYYFLASYGILSVVFFLVYDKFIIVSRKALDKFLSRFLKK